MKKIISMVYRYCAVLLYGYTNLILTDFSQSFQNYIQQSPYDACHRFDTGGTWRNFAVRSTQGGEKMGIVYIHPQNMPEDEIKEIKDDLRRYFFEGEGSECELDSLYLQAW